MKWVTRERVKVDRVACPWLVRRFIDPDATFEFLPRETDWSRITDANVFDVPGVELGHHDEDVSFDSFLKKFELDDPALRLLADIVRAADSQPRNPHPAGEGLRWIAHGFSAMGFSDHELLEREFIIYDALYAECGSRVRTESAVPRPEPRGAQGGVSMISKLLPALIGGAALIYGQNMPAEYAAVLKSLGKQGDYSSDVLKINIPRNDLRVSIDGIATPTPFGFGGWLAMTKGSGSHEVMMGDLVLLEDEVNPVMSALLDNGLDVTALHNHFFFESPRVFYMHVHGHGTAADLAKKVKPAVDLIGRGSSAHQSTVSGGSSHISGGQIDTTKIARIVGHEGEQSGQVYKITIGRDDIDLTEMGAKINARMGLNTWAAFYGTDANAEIAGDVAMLDTEITPVLKALRSHGLNVVAIHNHMTGGQPFVYFLHYWGTGSAEKLATGFKAALDQLGHKQHAAARTDAVPDQAERTVVFVCEHGSAKSVVAAAHFNRMAARDGLPYHAVARGLTPDSVISAEISRGLASDGLDVRDWQPRKVDETELSSAARVVTLGCQLPLSAADSRRDHWTDLPSITENYAAGRDAILSRVEQLVASLSDRRPQ